MLKLIIYGLAEGAQNKVYLYESKNYAQLKDELLIKDLTTTSKDDPKRESPSTTTHNGKVWEKEPK